ncbi:nucleotidyltransferase domain-containing protein [Roseofilum sp. SID1]|uniref:nucleotidyltransferase domain-containing protein n=1 Tax=unclassified Roseofilum TaxID=2620099 RepID=UPI00399FA5B6
MKKLKEYLQSLYQDNLDKVILFGSEARGEADIDSDIAILIVLKTPFVYVFFSPSLPIPLSQRKALYL